MDDDDEDDDDDDEARDDDDTRARVRVRARIDSMFSTTTTTTTTTTRVAPRDSVRSRRRGRGGGRSARAVSVVARADARALAPVREIARVSAKTVEPVAKPVIGSTTLAAGAAVAAAAAALAIKRAKRGSGSSKQKRIVIAGAPASGKGTQCELIVKKFGLTHISAGDLLRAAVAAGTEAGLKAKEYMDRGDLVPNEVVVTMVKERLSQPDCAKGWLLDGYPRSEEQADALIESGIQPDLFLLLDVPDEILLDRVIGRRLDPVDGTIYHMTFFPPPTPEIAARLTQRSDDTEEKASNRLSVHHKNVDAVVGKYETIMKTVDGNRAKQDVFKDIESLIKKM
jgi:adenylate kinase